MRPPATGTQTLRFEATGHLVDLRRVAFLFDGKALGGVVDIASGQDFRFTGDIVGLDIDDLLPPGRPPIGAGPISLDADVSVPAIPTPFNFCAAMPGRDLSVDTGAGEVFAPADPELTGACEKQNPFDDAEGAPVVEVGPLALHYRASAPFDVVADIEATGDVLLGQQDVLPIGFDPFTRVAAHVAVRNIPSTFDAIVGLPAEPADADEPTGSPGRDSRNTRVLVRAPGASLLEVDLVTALESDGASCNNPRTSGSVVCADAELVGLPETLSIINEVVTEPGSDGERRLVDVRTKAATCDLDITEADAVCREAPVGGIQLVEARLRTRAGEPDGVPTYVPPATSPIVPPATVPELLNPHVFAQVEFDSLEQFEVDAGFRLGGLTDLTASLGGNGVALHGRLGTGAEPLVIHAFGDLSEARGIPDAVPRLRARGDVVIDPLPAALDVTAGFSVAGDDPMSVIVHANDGADPPVTTDVNVDVDLAVDVPTSADPPPLGDRAHCADPGSICATLALRPVPGFIDATVARRVTPGPSRRTVDLEAHIDLGRPVTAVAGVPNVAADVTLGLPVDLPVAGGQPLRIQADVFDLPQISTIGLSTTELLRQEGTEVQVVGQTLDRVRAFACNRNLATDTCIDTLSEIGRIEVRAATFVERPDGLPVIAPSADQALAAVGRGKFLEALVRISRLAGVDFVARTGAAGAQVVFGTPDAGAPPEDDRLTVDIDIEDLPFASTVQIGPKLLQDPIADLKLAAVIEPFPETIDVCFTEPITATADLPGLPAFLEPCLDSPFDSADQPHLSADGRQPLGVAIHTGQPTTVTVGTPTCASTAPTTSPTCPSRACASSVTPVLANVPEDLRFHLLPQETAYENVVIGGETTSCPLRPVLATHLEAPTTLDAPPTGPICPPFCVPDLPPIGIPPVVLPPVPPAAPSFELSAALDLGDRASCEDTAHRRRRLLRHQGLRPARTSSTSPTTPTTPATTSSSTPAVRGPTRSCRPGSATVPARSRWSAWPYRPSPILAALAAHPTSRREYRCLVVDTEIGTIDMPLHLAGLVDVPVTGDIPHRPSSRRRGSVARGDGARPELPGARHAERPPHGRDTSPAPGEPARGLRRSRHRARPRTGRAQDRRGAEGRPVPARRHRGQPRRDRPASGARPPGPADGAQRVWSSTSAPTRTCTCSPTSSPCPAPRCRSMPCSRTCPPAPRCASAFPTARPSRAPTRSPGARARRRPAPKVPSR